jgi:cytochrome oxidase Cu insertion factor (SCO1/SenC/PrrC family)
MYRLVLSLVLTLLTAITPGCTPRTATSPATEREDFDLGLVGDFSLTDQDDQPKSRADLIGKVWVASFVFTRCGSVCPQVSATMTQLQHELVDQDGVLLVSFSVDPEYDSPSVLKKYGAQYGADSRRWWLLTGDRERIYGLISDSFKLSVQETEGKARTTGNEVIHSSRLVIVDRKGHIRGLFEGRRVDERGQPVNDLPALRHRIETLLQEKP